MPDLWTQRWSQAVALHRSRTALVTADGALTFGELGERADWACKHFKQRQNWRIGRCVALPWTTPLADLPALLGLWLAGGVWLAQDPQRSDGHRLRTVERDVSGPSAGAGLWHSILFSSGSTGTPKLIVRGWRQALQEADRYAERLCLPAGSRSTMLIKPWFGASTKHLLAGLLSGWELDLGGLGAATSAAPRDILYATPSQLLALGLPNPSSPRFRWISMTGEGCPLSLWPALQQWGVPEGHCLNALGASETGVIADQVLPLAQPWQPFAGHPFVGKTITLLDGQICVQGSALAEGYLLEQQGGWSLQSFTAPSGLMEVQTEDLGHWTAAGTLELIGRRSQLLKRHGEWIDATPLQLQLERCNGVNRCQLFSGSHGVVVWLELPAQRSGCLAEIWQQLLSAEIDRRLRPQRLLALEQFPLNSNGKIDLRRLQQAIDQPEALKAEAWPPELQPLELHSQLDSLDQAQLLAQMAHTNVIWCGGGWDALTTSRPAPVGLLRQPFPAMPSHWRAGMAASLSDLAATAVETLVALNAGRLGDQLWLGGYSLSAWLSYAMAADLMRRGYGVRGVVLVDPVDPFAPTYRWAWRRRLAHHWRTGVGRRWYPQLTAQQRHQKSWVQELVGQWEPPPLPCELLLIVSGWPSGMRPHQLVRLSETSRLHRLNTSSHEAVVWDPAISQEWTSWLWPQLL